MKDYIVRLQDTDDPVTARQYVDAAIANAKAGRFSSRDRGAVLRALLLNRPLQTQRATPDVVTHLLDQAGPAWDKLFGKAAANVLPATLAELIDQVSDTSHMDVLRLAGENPRTLLAILKELDSYLKSSALGIRILRGMRVARVMVDVYGSLTDPKIWRRRRVPPCCIDNAAIRRHKERREVAELPEAYEKQINSLQHQDLKRCLAALGDQTAEMSESTARMESVDFGKLFRVVGPLRLGISSANASDNHLRTKECGGKTLNAGVDLVFEDETAEDQSSGAGPQATPPLIVPARRIDEARLVLKSRSTGFTADFEANTRGNAAEQSKLFFSYRRGGDESLRMVKQALVHTGIIAEASINVIDDISRFTDGGGLEISTASHVLQGSGLGTSSILAAAILKLLYRLTGHPAIEAEGEYPALYDESVLLEQSLGLNSGWQDARGACGGPSAVKNFYAPPTEGLPAPELTFVDVDEDVFIDRVVLFDTGISRAATRGLNVVLEAYLSRNPQTFPAIGESLAIHDDIAAAMRNGDYETLGTLATRYWKLRCQLDPRATNESIQRIFEEEEFASLSEGGMLTGAGGGGFAIIISREGAREELVRRLGALTARKAFANSGVVDYRLNRTGLNLSLSD